MKFLQQFSAAAAIAVIFFISGCAQPEAPLIEDDVLTYSVDSSDRSLLADITYLDGDNKLIKLGDQGLPWSATIIVGSGFSGNAYLKAVIPQDEVFLPFAAGTADADVLKKLSDLSADFSDSGVIVGDLVYSNPSTLESADVLEIEDANTLSLKSDILPNGNESYYIYHEKTLTSSIIVNDINVKEVVSESERSLSCLVQTDIAR